ncbi:Six-hairpin glycosidase-like protein [Fomitopsis serialis]|uniref:Six-hairpin glycosidase-like protein n=1 Tax=Fomitopsis serialis TaxID=139415 RepID=UPI00200795E6|nr:Six-hairpin glycosidase-like protein [Neoantrodia serialis]KAH9932269.1 Six-hairpin glycosidase-like protein [Neoantrodia serialis]
MNEHYVNIKVDREERPDVDRLYMTFLQATTGGGGWPMSVWLTPELHPFFAGTYFPPGNFRQVLMKLADVWEDDPQRCRSTGQQVIEQLREATLTPASPSGSANLPIPSLAQQTFSRLARQFDSTHGGFGRAPKFPQVATTTGFLARFAAAERRPSATKAASSTSSEPPSADEVLSYLDAEPHEAGDLEGETGRPAKTAGAQSGASRAAEMAAFTMGRIYAGGVHDHVGGGVARYSVDERWHVPHFEKMLYDQAQLLRSTLELYLLLSETDTQRAPLIALARSILAYLPVLTSPDGGFFSAEDADSLPTFESTKKREGAFYTWTAAEIDEILSKAGQAGQGVMKAADVFKWAYGVEDTGNCDPTHDIQGELKGQNVLYLAHSHEETARMFGIEVAGVERVLNSSLSALKEWREKNRPRPHLDDKVVAGWNGLMISGLALAAEVLPGEEGRQAMRMAEGAARFVREKMYNPDTAELCRSWREGKGPRGVTEDYAFLTQGLLDLYEASGNEGYALWAIRLQEKQDELFFDKDGGGYYTSAPDPHILIRMKDAQDGAEPSAASVTLSNLYRLTHIAEDYHTEFAKKASSVLQSNAQLLEHAPFALGAMLANAMVHERGYVQMIVTESPTASPESSVLNTIRKRYMPHRVLIHFDPTAPPRELAKANGTLRSLVDDADKKAASGDMKPSVRVCKNFTCGLPVYDLTELESVLDT